MVEKGLQEQSECELREHYEIEKALATRLRRASSSERPHLYAEVYNQLFQRVPHHPQLLRKDCTEDTESCVSEQLSFLRRFINKDVTFLEVGSGDCALSIAIAKRAKWVYAVDVASEITRDVESPCNLSVLTSNGVSIPVPGESVNVAYSNQVMEHLHPDDALDQLRNIYKALAPGGIFICVTPNRLSGPHDVSRHFDDTATGLHLKEYTVGELCQLFKATGFGTVRPYLSARPVYLPCPAWPLRAWERCLIATPRSFRRQVAHSRPSRLLLGIRLVGIKPRN